MDYYLLFVLLSAICVFFLINLKMMFFYEEEDSGNIGRELPIKFMILWSWTFAYFMVFMLPVDVQHTRAVERGEEGNIPWDMHFFWEMMFLHMGFLVIFALPFCMFYIETKGDVVFNQGSGRRALLQLCFFIFFTIMFIAITYAFFNVAEIPVFDVSCSKYLFAHNVTESYGDVC